LIRGKSGGSDGEEKRKRGGKEREKMGKRGY